MPPKDIFLGARPYDFTNDKGERITGISVHSADGDVDGAVGYVADRVGMTVEDFKSVFGTLADFEKIIMKPVVISYNKRGKPVAYELVTQK